LKIELVIPRLRARSRGDLIVVTALIDDVICVVVTALIDDVISVVVGIQFFHLCELVLFCDDVW